MKLFLNAASTSLAISTLNQSFTSRRQENFKMKHQYRSTNHADSEPRIGLIRSAVQAIVRAYKRRAAIRQLEAFDDQMLRDIGVHRRQIRLAVKGLLNARATPSERTVTTQNTPHVTANDHEYKAVA